MCTLAIYWQCHPAAPLVVAQCRDEVLDRPALDVMRWQTERGVEVVSGRDVLAGGTWFGVGPTVVCGLTNRRDGRGPRRGTLSRGDLVVRALEMRGVAEVEAFLRGTDAAAYGPYSIIATDGASMLYADNGGDDDSLRAQQIAPGVHVLGNFGIDNPDDPVVRTVGVAARGLLGADEDALVGGLQDILARHGEGWPCVHLPPAPMFPAGYGTRSAGILVWRTDGLATAGAGSRFVTTAGAPCATPWRDSTELLDLLSPASDS